MAAGTSVCTHFYLIQLLKYIVVEPSKQLNPFPSSKDLALLKKKLGKYTRSSPLLWVLLF